jgi:hypothetical protein
VTKPDLTDVTAAERYADWATDDARRRLHRRVLIVVVTSQIFGGTGLAAGVRGHQLWLTTCA